MTCPSDKSIKESTHNSLIEAINYFFASRQSVEYFDIVIPFSVPIPVKFHKSIRIIPPQAVKPISKPVYTVLSEWDRPIPPATVEFKVGMKWLVAIPPYDKQNVFYLHYPLPGTKNVISGKGSSYKTLQIFNGILETDIYIDLGFNKAHIFPIENGIKLEFNGGRDAVINMWNQKRESEKKQKTMINRVKRFFHF